MKRLLLLLALTGHALAAEKQTVLSVPGMNCVACPVTVKKALMNVRGVISATIEFNNKRATVIFDDQKTSVAQLTQATAQAGYPSMVMEQHP